MASISVPVTPFGSVLLKLGLDSDSDSSDVCNFLSEPNKSDLKDWPIDIKHYLSPTSLVRSNGDSVDLDSVLQKYLLILCVSLPMHPNSLAAQCCSAIIGSYPYLSKHDFEMVLVIKTDSEADFNEVHSAFSCPAIPFSDSATRDALCTVIDSFFPNLSAIVVHPTGLVLQHRFTPQLFLEYGPQLFPFSELQILSINTQDEVLRSRFDTFYKKEYCSRLHSSYKRDPLLDTPLSLHEDILLCDPSLLLHRFASTESLTVSDLSRKHVGLYFCADGSFMGELKAALDHGSLSDRIPLEILLVGVSPFEDPLSCPSLVEALHRNNITTWFICPYSYKVCRRLWRVFARDSPDDAFVVLPPNNSYGELRGKEVITRLKINEYPFTRSSTFHRRLLSLWAIYPEYLYRDTCLYHGATNSRLRPYELLRKNVFLFLDEGRFPKDDGELCRLLLKHYINIRSKGWDVVFIPLDKEDPNHVHRDFAKMPWPTMRFNDAVKVTRDFPEILIGRDKGNQLIALKDTGRVVSIQVRERLKRYGVKDSLFDDYLRAELMAPLALIDD